MRKELSEEKFSVVKRAKSFTHAGRGVWVLFKTTHNAWVHLFVLLFVVLGGLVCNVTRMEWMMLILASGMVLAAEAFNTAIEIDIDLTSQDFHPYARDTKDVAAGAVLITTVAAAIVGLLVFWPYVTNVVW